MPPFMFSRTHTPMMFRGGLQAFEVFPSDENMHFWKVLLAGPGSTPYGGGCWMLSVFFPNRYLNTPVLR